MKFYPTIEDAAASGEIKDAVLAVLGDGSEAGLTETGVAQAVDYLVANEAKRFVRVSRDHDLNTRYSVATNSDMIFEEIQNAMLRNKAFKAIIDSNLR